MKSITLIGILLITTLGFKSEAFGKSPYGNDPHPFRAYFFGYDMNPGFGLGPEFTFSWTKMERSKCSRGARVSDRKFMLAPQFGAFQNESNSVSVFANLEVNYRTIFHGGFMFEIFGAGGYALMLDAPETATDPASDNGVVNKSGADQGNVVAKSGFMPELGLGIGYDLQQINGRDIPLAFNLRGLATSVAPTDLKSLVPGIQAGLIYSF